MALSRGERPVRVVEALAPHPSSAASPSVVIAVATTLDERIRLTRLADGTTPVLLVATAEEAIAFLQLLTPTPTPTPAPVEPATEPVEALDPPAPDRPAVVAVPDPEVVTIDSDWRVATWRNRSVSLSPLEHDLLLCLLEEVGRTWSFERLQRRVWGNDHLGGRSHLQAVVKRLRRKLTKLRAPLQIDAVRGVGLRLLHAPAAPPAG
jgi:hypothetical protein